MRKLTLALSIAALAMSGAAAAQTAPRQAGGAELTRAEAQSRAEARFVRMDANRDGTLNAADRAARQGALFDRLDTDRNGSISRAEFEAMQAKRADRREARGERTGAAMRAQRAMTQAAFVDRALARFDRADADRSGTLTQAERRAARESWRQQRRGAAGRQG